MHFSSTHRHTLVLVGTIFVVLLLLDGCELLGIGSSSELSGSTWQLTSFSQDEQPLVIPQNHTYEVSFSEESVGAVADCNECSGSYSTDGAEISILISCTEAACAANSLSLQFKNALLSAETYEREAGELTITYRLSDENRGTLTFERAK